jgi:hypothetical protein
MSLGSIYAALQEEGLATGTALSLLMILGANTAVYNR